MEKEIRLFCVFEPPLWGGGFRATYDDHLRNGRISTSGLKSDVTMVFLDPDYLSGENFGDSRTFKADRGLLNICMGFQDLLA